jgi:hypothetical protein
MKKMILTLIITFIFQYLFAPGTNELIVFKDEPIAPYEKLWSAICRVESNNNPLAYNFKEKAVGIAQVRLCRLKHYNRLTGEKIALKAMYDPLKAKVVFMYFTGGRDYETIARAWCSGERGTKKASESYWRKVKKNLADNSN